MKTNFNFLKMLLLVTLCGLSFLSCKSEKNKNEKSKATVEWQKDEFKRDVLHYDGEAGIIDITIKSGLISISGKNYGPQKTQMQVDIINAIFNINSLSTKHRVINAMGMLVNNPTAFAIGDSFTLGLGIPSLTGKDEENEDDGEDTPSGSPSGSGGFNIPSFSGNGMDGIPSVVGGKDEICFELGGNFIGNTGGLIVSSNPSNGWEEVSNSFNLMDYNKKTESGMVRNSKTETNDKGETRTTFSARKFDNGEVVWYYKEVKVTHQDGSTTTSEEYPSISEFKESDNQGNEVVTTESTTDSGGVEIKVTENGKTVYHVKDGEHQEGHDSNYPYVPIEDLKDSYGHEEKKENPEPKKPHRDGEYADNNNSDPSMSSESGVGGGTICYPSWMANQMINWNKFGEAVTNPVRHETNDDGTHGGGVGIGSLILLGEDYIEPSFNPDPSMILDKRIWITDPPRNK